MRDGPSEENDEERGDQHQPTPEVEANSGGGITTLEVVFNCLREPKRRFILYYLQDHEVATVDDLAAQIAAWETNRPLAEVDASYRERVASDLVHIHLPKLTETQFIEYDSRSNTLVYTDPPALLADILRLLGQLDPVVKN